MGYFWKPYVPVAERRRRAAREVARLARKGRAVAPVSITGRTIAATFWGKAWCDNLERYSDYANRLPRGRTYVRNGSVMDLQIGAGKIEALVCGTELYRVAVRVTAVPATRWSALRKECAGAISSLVELLQGRFSDAVMQRLCQEKTGLFPAPRDITFSCSCPDWADMCKHVAAVLYGIGARLDDRPELLFKLRQVDENELIAAAGQDLPLSRTTPAPGRVLGGHALSDLFGLDLGTANAAPLRAAAPPAAATTSARPREAARAAGPRATTRGASPARAPRQTAVVPARTRATRARAAPAATILAPPRKSAGPGRTPTTKPAEVDGVSLARIQRLLATADARAVRSAALAATRPDDLRPSRRRADASTTARAPRPAPGQRRT
jgi:hypothetical protein